MRISWALAQLLQLPEQHEQDPHLVVAAMQRWLATHREWLLILDNADDLAMVDAFLSDADTGQVLLTTRAQAGGSIAHTIEVEKMDLQEGVLLLLRRAKLIGSGGTSEQAALKHRAVAEAIVRELDGLPLALDQAGAYIEETQCSLSSYLERYRKRHLDLLHRRGNLPTDHPESVGTTWSLSFQQIKQTSPAAADLLFLCAFLDPDAIPEELFREGASELGPNLKSVATDAYFLDEAIAELRKYSLIRRNAEKQEVSIHRLVQAVLKEGMAKKTQCQWAERTVRAVACAFPKVDAKTMQQCQRYYPQSHICAALIDQYAFTFAEAVDLLNQTAFFLQEQAFYAEAEPLYRQALTIRAKTMGPKHPHTATSFHSLACLYHVQGKYEKAELLYQHAISITGQQLADRYSSTAASFSNLALLYLDQGKYEKAEALLKRALAIRQRQLGQRHPDTTYPLNNLAILYHEQSRYEEAEPLSQRALAIREKALGPEHPDTATSLNNLASLYCDLGRYEEAEPLYQRALAIREKVLGPEHPDTAIGLGNLSILYHKQGKQVEAESLRVRALVVREKALGPEHPFIATTLNL